MPIGRQVTGDSGLDYVPPPDAYHDPKQVSSAPAQRTAAAPVFDLFEALKASAPATGRPMAPASAAPPTAEPEVRTEAPTRSRWRSAGERLVPRNRDRDQVVPANAPPLMMAAEGASIAMPLPRQQAPVLSAPKSAVATSARDLHAPIAADISWRQQFYVYSAVLAIFAIVWLADGMFTVLGLLMSGIPATVLGFILACGFHLLASWGQRSLIFDPLPLLKAVGLALLGINVLSNIVGIRLAFAALAPRLAGTLPMYPGEWLLALLDWAGSALTGKEAVMPAWWPTALIIAMLGGSLAWFAEKLLAQVHVRWKVICEQRPR